MSNPLIGNAYTSAQSAYGQYFAPDADAGDAAASDDNTIIEQMFGAYGAAGSVAPTSLINANSIEGLINSGATSSVSSAAYTAALSAAASGNLQLSSSYEQLGYDAGQGASSQTLQNDLLHVLGVVVTNQGSSSGAAQTPGSDLDQGYIGNLNKDLSDNSQTTGTDIQALENAIQTGQLTDSTGNLASTLAQFGNDWSSGNSGNYQQDLTAVEGAYAQDNTTSSTNVSGEIFSDIQTMQSGAASGDWGAVGTAAADIANLDPNAVGNSQAISKDASWIGYDLHENHDPTSDIATLLQDTETANHYTSNT